MFMTKVTNIVKKKLLRKYRERKKSQCIFNLRNIAVSTVCHIQRQIAHLTTYILEHYVNAIAL